MKFFLSFSIFILLSACGGGGGGSSNVYSGIDWVNVATTWGTSAYVRDYGSSSTSNSDNVCKPSSAFCNPGAEIYVNGSSIKLTSDHGSNEVDFNPGWTFTDADYVGSPRVGAGTNLSSVNHNWSATDAANGYTRKLEYLVPDNYSHQIWLYWDNLHATDSNYNTYYSAVIGTSYTTYANLPSSGSASYAGAAEMVYMDNNLQRAYTGSGTANFSVNWSAKTISGTLGEMALTSRAGNTTFPAMTMASTSIVSRTSYAEFTGNLVYNGYASGSYYNQLHGAFFGDTYQEIGGNFDITSSSSNDGAGYFAAKK
tara:strand:+ start:3020 stop:3955 length:936 start_codon:yes stop_codon:yes gene_type:complete